MAVAVTMEVGAVGEVAGPRLEEEGLPAAFQGRDRRATVPVRAADRGVTRRMGAHPL